MGADAEPGGRARCDRGGGGREERRCDSECNVAGGGVWAEVVSRFCSRRGGWVEGKCTTAKWGVGGRGGNSCCSVSFGFRVVHRGAWWRQSETGSLSWVP